jgi:hypothetical protein
LRGGEIGFIPGGNRVLWEVHSTVKKGFHISDGSGLVLADWAPIAG